jgi:predicted dehydrogenase
MSAEHKIRWGILGPGNIAQDFLAGAAGSHTGIVAAIGARNPAKPGLAQAFPGIRLVAGYDALIADPDLDAIYIALPHPFHAEWAIKASNAGKHVLCEKPMAMSAAQVEAMYAAAQQAGTFLGEAVMYRFHPLTARIITLLRDGAIGDVRMIRSNFGFAFPRVDPDHRLFAPSLGGGAILDIGGYPLTMARLIAGYRTPGGIVEPVSVKASAHIGQTGVDEWSSALLAFPGGILADLSCSISVRQDNVLHVMGTAGRMEVDDFWFGTGKTGGVATIRLIRPDGTVEPITVEEPRHLYAFQFEAANEAIRAKAPGFAWPGMTREDTLANAHALDRWLAEALA